MVFSSMEGLFDRARGNGNINAGGTLRVRVRGVHRPCPSSQFRIQNAVTPTSRGVSPRAHHFRGRSHTHHTVTRERIREVLSLEVVEPDAAGMHDWQVVAEPPVPGLGFSLTMTSWLPWPKEQIDQGVELQSVSPAAASVGEPAELVLRVVAPSGRPPGVASQTTWPLCLSKAK